MRVDISCVYGLCGEGQILGRVPNGWQRIMKVTGPYSENPPVPVSGHWTDGENGDPDRTLEREDALG